MIKFNDNHNDNTAAGYSDITALFASPFRNEGKDSLADAIRNAVRMINELKPEHNNSSAFLGNCSDLKVDRNSTRNAVVPYQGESLDEIISQVVAAFNGLPNWGHPLNMSNICPQENIAAIIASMLSQVFSPNILEAEYAWNTAKAELESSAMLAALAGWDVDKAGGVYTYGGSGCWMYHLKYALSRVLPDSRKKGIRTDAKVICSEQAHYAMLNSTDWTGLGMNNIITIRTLPDTNIMDLQHLEHVLKECQALNTPVVSVICTMATTDACAFDPVKEVRQLMDQYPNSSEYGKSFLYCDAVIGWSWLAFGDYDFDNNPQQFSESVLNSAKRNAASIKDIYLADAFGVDFHKNFAPLVSSIFMYKNAEEFEGLLGREQASYLQERGDYNPHDYTLEVSRSAAGSMTGWATLKHLGIRGIQSVLARGLQNKNYFLERMSDYKDMVCVNTADNGSAILLRIYSSQTDAESQYADEFYDSSYKNMLLKHNKFTENISELLWKWFREKKQLNGHFTPYVSITKGFRPAIYNDGTDKEAVVYAIKVYPVNVFVTPEIMDHALFCIRMARDEIVNNEM